MNKKDSPKETIVEDFLSLKREVDFLSKQCHVLFECLKESSGLMESTWKKTKELDQKFGFVKQKLVQKGRVENRHE